MQNPLRQIQHMADSFLYYVGEPLLPLIVTDSVEIGWHCLNCHGATLLDCPHVIRRKRWSEKHVSIYCIRSVSRAMWIIIEACVYLQPVKDF